MDSSVKNNNSINGDIIKLTITKVITAIIATLTSMLLARYRSLEEYGTYSQMLIVINLFTSIFMLGLPNSLNYFIGRADNEAEKQEFINVYYTLSTILSFILGISLSLSAHLIANYFNNVYIKTFIYFLALYPWTKIISTSIENLLVVYKKTKLLLIIKLIHNSLLLTIVFAFQYLRISFEIYMICFTGLELLFTLFDYFLIRKISGSLKPQLVWKMVKKILVFSIPIGLASVIGIINIELDKIVIDHYFSTEELAIYTACSAELPLTLFASSITAVALPVMVVLIKNNEFEKAVDKWKKTVIVSFFVLSLFSFGMFFFAEDAVNILYGEKYLPGANVFRVYSIVLLFKCTYWGTILNSVGKTKFILISSIVSLIFNVCFNFLFYYLFGFIGPALATLVSTLFMTVAQLIATAKITKIKFFKLLPMKSMFTITILNILLGSLFVVIKYFLPLDQFITSIFETLILAVLWSLIYILLCGRRIIRVFKSL